VHVERGHKDRDLQPGILEIFLFHGLFDHHYLTVGRSINESGIRIQSPDGQTKKEKNENIEHNGDKKEYPSEQSIRWP
jgi:hypothetical protein